MSFPMSCVGARSGQDLVFPVGPFADWLADVMRARGLNHSQLATILNRDEHMVRCWFDVRSRSDAGGDMIFIVHTINEPNVERAGLILADNPRLVAELYPHMSEESCRVCGRDACEHLGPDLDESCFDGYEDDRAMEEVAA